MRGGRVGVDVALAHAHDPDGQRDVKAGGRGRLPTTNSVEPPPMSITTVGSVAACRPSPPGRVSPPSIGRPAIAPRNVSCASSSPLSTRASRPKSSRTRAANVGPVGGVAHGGGEHGEVGAGSRGSRSRRGSPRACERPARRPRSESEPSASTPCAEARDLRAPEQLAAPIRRPGRRRRSAGGWSWCRCQRRRRARAAC